MPKFDATLTVPIKWNAAQWAAISWRPPAIDGNPPIERCGILGEFGSGKTTCGAARCLMVCLENPYEWSRGYRKGDQPMTIVVAPSMSMVLQVTLPRFKQICPPELIVSERLWQPHNDLTLANGHVIKFAASTSSIDGPSVCQLWADEAQKREYTHQWENLLKRVRDRRARRLNFQITGLPQHGPIADQWRVPVPPHQATFILKTRDNEGNLAAGYLDAKLGSLAASSLNRDPDGWTTPSDLLYQTFGEANLSLNPPLDSLRGNVTHLGVDLRRRASVVFAQTISVKVRKTRDGGFVDEPGVLIVDELLPDRHTAEEICARIHRETKWQIDHRSVITMDPTLSDDEVNWFKRSFPRARVILERNGPYKEVETGEEAVDRAVRDALGNVRLFVHPHLRGKSKRGVVEMFRGFLARKTKDGGLEHTADAVRYIVQHLLPLPTVRGNMAEQRKAEDSLRQLYKPQGRGLREGLL